MYSNTYTHTHTSLNEPLASYLKYAAFFACVSVKKKKKKKGEQAREKGKVGQERSTERRREKLSHRTALCEQLWHSQISPWLLSAGTWTLGLLGFGGQPRPHNPPSAPSSCLTPPWPRSEDRKIRAVPSQRDSFILPVGMLPVTRAYIMGNIAGPRRKQPLPPFLFFLTNRSSPFYPISVLLFLFLFPLLCTPPLPPHSILFLPLCTPPPLLFVIYLFGPTRLGTFITDSLDTILKPSHQQCSGTEHKHTDTLRHTCGRLMQHALSILV